MSRIDDEADRVRRQKADEARLDAKLDARKKAEASAFDKKVERAQVETQKAGRSEAPPAPRSVTQQVLSKFEKAREKTAERQEPEQPKQANESRRSEAHQNLRRNTLAQLLTPEPAPPRPGQDSDTANLPQALHSDVPAHQPGEKPSELRRDVERQEPKDGDRVRQEVVREDGARSARASETTAATEHKQDVKVEERKEEATTASGATRDSDERVGEKQESSGGGQGGGGDGQGGQGQGMPGFRFNPALMAPVAVAQKSNVADSEKLRRLAAELAQRIVERVRVGTNAAGMAEFQIDLRDEVLGGLTVKVSASGGKVRAVFSSSRKDVLELLKGQSESLKGALGGRGLTLEELRIEGRD